MARGRINPGQRLDTAISARAWNRAQDAADLVLGDRAGVAVDSTTGRAHVLGKTSTTWQKGTAANITLWAGPSGSEVQTSDVIRAWNKFSTVPGGRFVMLGRVGSQWYLIAAEC
jgi:hypothetical protein